MKRSIIVFVFTLILTVAAGVWIYLTKSRLPNFLDIFLFFFGGWYMITSIWAFIFKELYISTDVGDSLNDKPIIGITAILMGATIFIGGLIIYILPFILFKRF